MRLMKVTSLDDLDTSKEYLAYIRYGQEEDQANYIGLAHLYASGQDWNAEFPYADKIWDTNINRYTCTLIQFCIELD